MKYIQVLHLDKTQVSESLEIWLENALPVDLTLKKSTFQGKKRMVIEVEALSREDLRAKVKGILCVVRKNRKSHK